MASNIEIDPALCEQYAQFASHLERWQFKILYWTLFFTNLAVLFFASWVYTKYDDGTQGGGGGRRREAC